MVITSNLNRATAMAFLPGNRILIALQDGELRIVNQGKLLATPVVTLSVDSLGERGLIGVAVDPGFASNRFIYLHYTVPSTPRRNRVSRFTLNNNTVIAGSEKILIQMDPLSSAGNHNGGALHFGNDGKLYIAVGENANSSNAQSLNNLLGKILRINKDGTIPTDNPFYNALTGKRRAIWAYGLRNPFTFAFGKDRMFINDVGAQTWEEINDGIAGVNYGWPNTEGETTNPAYVSPLYAYEHDNACAIAGGDFYDPVYPMFPSSYNGDYFFADYCGDWIKVYDPTTDTATDFALTTSIQPVDMRVKNDGSLYYLTRTALYRIVYDAGAVNGNLVANGNFEIRTNYSKPAFWELIGGNDRVRCNKPGVSVARSGHCAFQFVLGTATLSQEITGGLQSGDVLTLHAWVRTNSSKPGLMKVIVIYPGGVSDPRGRVFGAGPYDYTEFTRSVPLTAVPERVKVQIKSTQGGFFVDDVSLRKS